METSPLVNIEIDQEKVYEIVQENIQEYLKTLENEQIFYTLTDLQEITGMSKGFIEKTFLHDSRFVKIRRKVGRKWLFPVEETREFLKLWISEQPNS